MRAHPRASCLRRATAHGHAAIRLAFQPRVCVNRRARAARHRHATFHLLHVMSQFVFQQSPAAGVMRIVEAGAKMNVGTASVSQRLHLLRALVLMDAHGAQIVPGTFFEVSANPIRQGLTGRLRRNADFRRTRFVAFVNRRPRCMGTIWSGCVLFQENLPLPELPLSYSPRKIKKSRAKSARFCVPDCGLVRRGAGRQA